MVFWKKKWNEEKNKNQKKNNSRFGWRKYFNSKKKSSTFHCLDPNCVRRCNNKSSGFYLFTKWIWLYCTVLFSFLWGKGGEGGVLIWSSWRVCVCVWIVEVLCENSVNVKSTSGVFLHNKTITDLSTSDCLVTLMNNLFVRVMRGGEKCQRGAWTTSQH